MHVTRVLLAGDSENAFIHDIHVYICTYVHVRDALNNILREAIGRVIARAEYRCALARVFSPRPLPASMWIEIAFQPRRTHAFAFHAVVYQGGPRALSLLPYPLLGTTTCFLPRLSPVDAKLRDTSVVEYLWKLFRNNRQCNGR